MSSTHGRTLHRLGAYREYAPPAALARYVEALWTHRAPASAPAVMLRHRVLPNVGLSLCFQYRRAGPGHIEAPSLLLIGPVHTPRLFHPEPGWILEAVQLRPEWGEAVLGVAPQEYIDAFAQWPQAGAGAGHLLDQAIAAVQACGSALAPLLGWTETRWAEASPTRSAFLAHAALGRLVDRPGRPARVDVVARDLGVSVRHLRRAVCSTTSGRPKYLQRVRRLNRVLAEADGHDAPNWASAAPAHGYYDQAHLIRDCRALSGSTPATLHRERRAEHVLFFQSAAASSS